jgi:hypothetical protein
MRSLLTHCQKRQVHAPLAPAALGTPPSKTSGIISNINDSRAARSGRCRQTAGQTRRPPGCGPRRTTCGASRRPAACRGRPGGGCGVRLVGWAGWAGWVGWGGWVGAVRGSPHPPNPQPKTKHRVQKQRPRRPKRTDGIKNKRTTALGSVSRQSSGGSQRVGSSPGRDTLSSWQQARMGFMKYLWRLWDHRGRFVLGGGSDVAI